jgi:hypothetical protein
MKYVLRVVTLTCIVTAGIGGWVSSGYGEPYELSKNDVMDPKALKSAEISLFGVKLGDSEAKALDSLVNEKIPGVKVEQTDRSYGWRAHPGRQGRPDLYQ